MKEELEMKLAELRTQYTEAEASNDIPNMSAIKDEADEVKKQLKELESKVIVDLSSENVSNELHNLVAEAPCRIEIPSTNIQPVLVENKEEFNLDIWKQNYNLGQQLSKSGLIPDTYKGKPENCVIAVGMAMKMNLDPFTVMQNLNIVRGKASWSGSFCKTLIERSGKYKNVRHVYIGEKGKPSYGCYLQATEISTEEIIKGPEVTIQMATDEGWTSNKKWINLQDLMLAYRAASFFARVYVPEALNGVYTAEENSEIIEQKLEVKDVL